ncbi:MAG: flippase [Actinomycetota bacterium]|nr:flippase [Actinomycetota bacterium]
MDEPTSNGMQAKQLGHTRHLAKHAALLLSSGVVGYAGAFALNVLLGRALGQSGLGAWAIAYAATQASATLGLLGANWILVRQGSYYHGIGDLPRLRRTIHLTIFLAGGALLLISGGLVLLAPLLDERFFEGDSLVPMLRLAALAIPIVGIGQVMLYATQAFKNMRVWALVKNILQPTIRVVTAVIALLIATTPLSAFAGLVVGEIIVTATATFALHRRLPLFGPTDRIGRRELIRFALPAWGSRVVETSRAQLFPVMLGSLASLSQTGAYVTSKRISLAPSAINAALNQVYSPMASNLYLQNRREELTTLFKSMGKWSFTLAFPLFCLQVAFPKEILSIFGPDFRDASTALVVLAFSVLFIFGTGPVTNTLILTGRSRLAFYDYLAVVGTEIVLGFWLIPRYGVLGAAVAHLAGTALNNLLPLWQVWSAARLHPYRLDYWKPIIAGLASVLVGKGVIALAGVGSGVVAAVLAVVIIGLVYLGLLLVMGLGPEDRAAIGALTGRLGGGRDKDPSDPDALEHGVAPVDEEVEEEAPAPPTLGRL